MNLTTFLVHFELENKSRPIKHLIIRKSSLRVTIYFFLGDRRVNQQPALISLQTIWHREHNRIAKNLKRVNPNWNDETLFQESRKIVVALIQHITYHQYLQEILGNTIMNKFDLRPKSSGYFTSYNDKFKPMIRNSFSAAAYRFGHSMINDKMSYHPTKTFSTNIMSDLRNIVLKPDWIYRKDGGVGAITKGLYETNAQSVDMWVLFISKQYLTNVLSPHSVDAHI